MATIYQTNKKTGITYVIESESYWDKEKQQPRSHRTIIGKIDPDTGAVVPTKRYDRRKKASSPSQANGTGNHEDYSATGEQGDLAAQVRDLEQQVVQLRKEKEALIRDLNNVLRHHSS